MFSKNQIPLVPGKRHKTSLCLDLNAAPLYDGMWRHIYLIARIGEDWGEMEDEDEAEVGKGVG